MCNFSWDTLYITTDEAWFYISDTNGITKIQYISRSKKNAEIGVYENRKLHTKGIMVWAGISYFDKTNLYFIDPHTRINSDYYVNHVFKKILARDSKQLFPNDYFDFD